MFGAAVTMLCVKMWRDMHNDSLRGFREGVPMQNSMLFVCGLH